MQKLFAILLAMAMALTIPHFASAASDSPASIEVKTNFEYAFVYMEYTDSSNRIIRSYSSLPDHNPRTFSRAVSVDASQPSDKRTKAILTSLGMSPDFVNELSAEDLEVYATSPQITSIVSYTKTDGQGNVTPVTEEEAIAVTSIDPGFENITHPGDGAGNPAFSTVEEDTYMKIVFIVTELGDGRYKFSVDAEWLTMPYFRFLDCIGIAVQHSSVSYGSLYGWYKYSWRTTTYFESTTNNLTQVFSDSDFAQPSPSAWDGGAATFQLPVDYSDEYSAITNYDFKVHFELEATVVHPAIETVFNATATYDHSIVSPDIDLSINLTSLDGLFGCVLGWGINSETRIAYFDEPFRYIPGLERNSP